MIVLDTSALLAWINVEPGGNVVASALLESCMSVVNYGEVVGYLAREGMEANDIDDITRAIRPLLIVPDEAVARDAGLMLIQTRRAGLSLGDRFCLALARRLEAPVLTADRAWQDVAKTVGVDVRLIR